MSTSLEFLMEFLLQTTHLLPKTDPLSLAGLKPELLRQRLQQRLRHLDASPARLTAAMPLLGRLGCLGRGVVASHQPGTDYPLVI